MIKIEDPESHRPNKTAIKRQIATLQTMVEQIVALPAAQLVNIPLDEPKLVDAIDLARQLTSHGAKRRQMQYIGKLLRSMDVTPIQLALDKLLIKDQARNSEFQKLEKWRDKLIENGDTALQAFLQIKTITPVDTQQLRQLIRNAQQEKKHEKNQGAAKALFRYLREVMFDNGA